MNSRGKLLKIGLGIVAVFLLLSFWQAVSEIKLVQKEAANLEKKIREAEGSLEEIQKLKVGTSNPDYLERQARLKLNYKKPDEQVVFVYKNSYNASQETNVTDIKESIWSKFLQWLRGK